ARPAAAARVSPPRHRLTARARPALGLRLHAGPSNAGRDRPFELRRGAGSGVVLARNTRWWGTGHGLGPALDQVQLRIVPGADGRVRLLRRGDVEAAWSLPAAAAEALGGNPLLTGLPAPADLSVGLERSVRGIETAIPPPLLSGV